MLPIGETLSVKDFLRLYELETTKPIKLEDLSYLLKNKFINLYFKVEPIGFIDGINGPKKPIFTNLHGLNTTLKSNFLLEPIKLYSEKIEINDDCVNDLGEFCLMRGKHQIAEFLPNKSDESVLFITALIGNTFKKGSNENCQFPISCVFHR